MKKTILFLMAMFVLASGIATAAPKKKVDALDATIREASDYLNGRIPNGNKVVFLNISSIYPDLSEYMLAMLSENAVNDMVFLVVDRAQLDAIRAELNFQFSGEVDDSSAQEIGKMLGAQMIVSGAITKVGTIQRLQVKAIEVQTASVRGQWSANLNKSTMLTALTKNQTKPAASGTARSATAGTRTQTAAAGRGTQTASSGGSAAPAAAAAVPARQTGIANGTYTLWPRPRATQGGMPTNFYLAQIEASNDFIIFYFARSAQGDFSNGHNGFWEANHFTLQDLDNPSRFYKPALDKRTSNGMGTIWLISFKRFPATRFKLYTERGGYPYSNDVQIIWEEIKVGDPDK